MNSARDSVFPSAVSLTAQTPQSTMSRPQRSTRSNASGHGKPCRSGVPAARTSRNFRPINVRTRAAVHTWPSAQPCAAPQQATSRAWSAGAGRADSRSRRGLWNATPRVRPSPRCGATGGPTSHSPVTPGRCKGLPRPHRRGQRPASVSLPGACAARRSARPRPDTACLRHTGPDGPRHPSRHKSRPRNAEISKPYAPLRPRRGHEPRLCDHRPERVLRPGCRGRRPATCWSRSASRA